jgi:beta-lactamase regulating signal transducer with metallopeptidase domain
MFSIDPLLSSPVVEPLGWMLVHACWQGTFVAALLVGLLWLLRGHTPSVRYGVSCVALGLLIALPVGTGLLFHTSSVGTAGPVATAQGGEPETAQVLALLQASSVEAVPSFAWTQPATWDDAAASVLRPWLPWMVAAWSLGLLLAAGRLAGGALHVRRLRRRSTPASEPWPDRLAHLADRLGVRTSVPLRVVESIDGPMVTGWVRPMVLVPAGMLTGLPPNQVEALLLHELAHVRRHDVLVGWLQAVVEAALFFHPAVWWISGRLRRERELCCDDLTVETGADTLVYAEALTAVAEQQVRPTLALAASDGPLLQRIRRLVAPRSSTSDWKDRVSLGASAVLLVALPVLVAACASQQGATAEDTSASNAEASAAAADSTDAASIAVAGDEEETVLRMERDSGAVTVYRMRVSGDSTERVVRVYPDSPGDSLGRSHHRGRLQGPLLFSQDDSTESLRFFPHEGRAFAFRFDEDSLMVGVAPDSLLAHFRAPNITFSRDSLLRSLPSRPKPPAVPVPDTVRPDSSGGFEFRLYEDGDTLRESFDEEMERLREWKEEWQREWESEWPERHHDLERSLRRWQKHHADSLEQRAEEWAEHFGEWQEKFADEWAFDNREELEQWMQRFEEQAGSVRGFARRFQEHMESERWERELRMLREQAERLREQAERLEGWAREMEERLPPDSLR